MVPVTLSFIIPTRNDGYAGWSANTLAENVNQLINALKKSDFMFEIILVEWNPGAENQSITKNLKGKINSSSNVKVKAFSAPRYLHKRYKYWNVSAFCSHGAINFGLRRASGKFCIIKMQDTIYSKSLLDWFSRGVFDEALVYRADRVIVEPHVWERNYGKAGSAAEVIKQGRRELPIPGQRLHTNACGDFMLMAASAWSRIRGQEESGKVQVYGPDGLTLAKAIGSGLSECRLPNDMVIFKPAHSRMYTVRNNNSKNVDMPVDSWAVYKFIKQIKALKFAFKSGKTLLLGIFNLPRNYDRLVPIDSIHRYKLKFIIRRYFFRFMVFRRNDWGFPDLNVEPVDLN